MAPVIQRGWTLALMAIAAFIVMLDTMVVTLALDTIRHDLGASLEALEWSINAYSLPFAVLLLPAAVIGDRFGRRRTLVSGLCLFLLGSVGCALAPSADWLIAARALQGIGASCVTPLAVSILGAAYSREERARAIGIFTSISGLALIAGPVIGGAVTQGLAWQWIFWINIPIGLVLVPLICVRVEDSFGERASLDYFGLVLVTAAAFAVVWGLTNVARAGFASADVYGWLLAGAMLAITFVLVETRVTSPMVPMTLFRSRTLSAGVGAGFLFAAGMYGVLFLLPQFLQVSRGYDAFEAGLHLLPWTAMLFIFAPVGGALVNRVGARALVIGGVLAQAAGFIWLARIAESEPGYLQLVLPLMLAGAGVSMAMPACQTVVLNGVAPGQLGKAAGTYNMFRFVGGVAGVAIGATLFAMTGSFASPHDFTRGFVAAALFSAFLSVLAAGVGLLLPGRSQRRAATNPAPASQ